MSIDRGVDKEDSAYIHTMKYYLAFKNNEIMTVAATWKDRESVTPSDVSQTEEKYCMTSLTGGI